MPPINCVCVLLLCVLCGINKLSSDFKNQDSWNNKSKLSISPQNYTKSKQLCWTSQTILFLYKTYLVMTTERGYLYIYIYVYILCLSFCPFVSNKRLNRSGPNFVWDLTWPQGRFIDAKNYKKLFPKVFDFCLIKIFLSFYIVQGEDSHR